MRHLFILTLILVSCIVASAGDFETTNKTPEAAAVRRIDASRATMFLYSINPEKLWLREGEAPEGKYFCRYRVIGSTEIHSADERARVLRAFADSIFDFVGDSYLIECFNPRHGMRLVIDGRTIDFLICFECAQVEAKGFGKISGFLIHGEAQPVFNEVLRAHRVKLARAPRD